MRVKRIFITAAVFIAAFAAALSGCGEKNSMPEFKRDVFAMDTYMSLRVFGIDGEKSLDHAEDEIQRLERLFSVTDEKSDIAGINLSGSAKVYEDTAELITMALNYCEMTSGALDITVYPLLREWGFTTGNYHVPDKQVIDSLLEKVGYEKVSVNDGVVSLKNGGAADLGAVAKGYTSDRVCEIIRKQGITSALVNLGGNVQAIGAKPDGSPWKVGIEDPRDNSKIVCSLSIEDKAVVTSGDYERYFIGDDGRRYCHIIDPKTGMPADKGLISVTIIGKNGTECDALSTALFVMGTEGAEKFLENHKEIEAVLIDGDMKVYMTEGAAELAELSEGYENAVIKRQGKHE